MDATNRTHTYPEYIVRVSDGAMLKNNGVNEYTFVKSEMDKPHVYTYECLMYTYSGHFREVLNGGK